MRGGPMVRPSCFGARDRIPKLGVIPAKAGTHFSTCAGGELGPSFRWDDIGGEESSFADRGPYRDFMSIRFNPSY